jgi:hypothetical protein
MKKKLTLDVSTLRVEPFEPSPSKGPHGGTVNAYEDMAAASVSYCAPCYPFTEGPLCGPLTSYRCV